MIRHVTQADLSAYMDGEARRPERIERHLAQCAACQAHLAAFGAVSAHVKALRSPSVHPSFAANVVGRIREAQPARSASHAPWRSYIAPAMAVAMVMLIAGVLAFNTPRPGDQPAETISQTASTSNASSTEPASMAQVVLETASAPSQDVMAALDEVETPYAEKSDTAWMFSRQFREAEVRPAVPMSEPFVVRTASVAWFRDAPAVSLTMDDGRDLAGALNSMDDNARHAFLLLLNDFAREDEAN